ncbi:MAG: FtsX-like permease family protein [Actinomycetota bacterium]
MNRLAFRNVVANPARAILISVAIAIGVSFVAATFIFSDSLSRTFDDLTTDIIEDVDLEVRSNNSFGTDSTLTNDLMAEIAATDGVTAIAGNVESEDVAPLTPAGELAEGIPVAISWVDHDALSGFELVQGRAPGNREFVLNEATAERDGFQIGDAYRISTPVGLVERTLSGTVQLEGDASFGSGFAFSLYPLGDAQAIFGGPADAVETIQVIVDDQSTAADVQAQIATLLPDGAEVVSSRTVQEELAAEFNDQIGILRNVLLGFAIVSVFVSTFIIRNTFGIVLTQRIRELGLLRAIGADGRQVSRSILAEAAVIGAFASAVGLALGIGVTYGLGAAFRALGAPLPTMDLVLALRTVVICAIVGLGATITSALAPARQGRRLTPVAALAGHVDGERDGRLRVVIGLVLAALGLTAAALGLFVASGTAAVLSLLGGGIAVVFIGITMASPVFASPIIGFLGAPLSRIAGTSGALARQNARRNPRRTANTAAALMIGLSLITTVLVVGESIKSHLASTLDEAVTADFVISNDFEPVPVAVATDLESVPEVTDVLGVSDLAVELTTPVGTTVTGADAIPLDTVDQLFNLGFSTTLTQDSAGTAVLSGETAAELGVTVGDELPVRYANGATDIFEVAAFYSDTTLIDSGILLDRTTVAEHVELTTVDWVATRIAPGTDVAAATAALDRFAETWPQVDVQTSTDYRESVEADLDQLLSIVNVLLALSILIALIGIGLTLALSVYERTREIGLLRAVGMSARQVRRMVRWEAALIGLFGAVLGVATGLAYGWGAATALPDNITSGVAIPARPILQLVLASAVAALVAALLPARRAGRLNVLDAISR